MFQPPNLQLSLQFRLRYRMSHRAFVRLYLHPLSALEDQLVPVVLEVLYHLLLPVVLEVLLLRWHLSLLLDRGCPVHLSHLVTPASLVILVHLVGPGDLEIYSTDTLSDLQNQFFQNLHTVPYMFSRQYLLSKIQFFHPHWSHKQNAHNSSRRSLHFSLEFHLHHLRRCRLGIFPTYISMDLYCHPVHNLHKFQYICLVFPSCHCMMSGSVPPNISYGNMLFYHLYPLFPECPAHLLSLPMCTASDRKDQLLSQAGS